MKKSLIFLLSPGLLYILFSILDYAFGFQMFSLFAPFVSINDTLPFGYILPSFFIPILIYAILIAVIHLIICIIKKQEKILCIWCLIPFASIISGIVASVFFLFVIGMFSIIFRGEYM